MDVKTCPSCNYEDYTFLSKADSFVEIIGDKKFVQQPYSIYECKHCGLYFKSNILSEEDLNLYYNSIDFRGWNPDIPYPTEIIITKFLNRYANNSLKLLDFGCSEGRFLSTFINKFNCFGFDIDKRAVLIAEQKGIKILDQEQLSNKRNEFDFIILSDVFEHSSQPTILIENLFSLLNKNGVLIISTGYGDAKSCQFDIADYWYFRTVQHLCMLGNKYIEYVSKKMNAIVEYKNICAHYNADFFNKLIKNFIFSLKFFIYKNITLKKLSFQFKLFSKIPYLKKITKWRNQPFYPFFKDHIVVFFRKV